MTLPPGPFALVPTDDAASAAQLLRDCVADDDAGSVEALADRLAHYAAISVPPLADEPDADPEAAPVCPACNDLLSDAGTAPGHGQVWEHVYPTRCLGSDAACSMAVLRLYAIADYWSAEVVLGESHTTPEAQPFALLYTENGGQSHTIALANGGFKYAEDAAANLIREGAGIVGAWPLAGERADEAEWDDWTGTPPVEVIVEARMEWSE